MLIEKSLMIGLTIARHFWNVTYEIVWMNKGSGISLSGIPVISSRELGMVEAVAICDSRIKIVAFISRSLDLRFMISSLSSRTSTLSSLTLSWISFIVIRRKELGT